MSAVIEHNIAKVRQQIREAEKKNHRSPHSVQLMAVSKTRSADDIRTAVHAGITHIGESYLQEALDKIDSLEDLAITWHFIGPIQSNKTRPIAEHFDWVHSVERLKIAKRLSEQRPASSPPLNVCIQVNVSSEKSKSGVSIADTLALAEQVSQLPNIMLRGLMAIPQFTKDPQLQRLAFAKVRELVEEMQQRWPTVDTLSMGMSNDMLSAIAEGATIVRIGTDIFGART